MSKKSVFVGCLALGSLLLQACESPSDATLAKSYTPQQLQQEICAQSNQCAYLDLNTQVFIEQGWLFRYDRTTQTKTLESNLNGLKEVVAYKGYVVTLSQSGEILFHTNHVPSEVSRSSFHLLPSQAQHIAVQGDDLLAILGSTGELWRYRNNNIEPFCRRKHLGMRSSRRKSKSSLKHLYCDGARVALDPTRIQGLRSFVEIDHKVYLVETSGRTTPYSASF